MSENKLMEECMKFRKNLLASVLCLALAVLCTVGLIACSQPLCDHQWGEWSAAENGTRTRSCTLCGATQTENATDGATNGTTDGTTEAPTDEPHVHDWADATCKAPKTCRGCGATEGEKLAHSFGEWTETTAATCSAAGEKTRRCKNCDAVETEPIAAKGHTFTRELVAEGTLKSAADCTHPAVYFKSCADCDAVSTKDFDTFESGSAKGHTYDKEIVTADALKSAATCRHAATYYKSCACGAVSDQDADVFSAGEKAAHSFTAEVVKEDALKSAATCTGAAVYYKSCEACGEVSTKDTDTFTSGTARQHDYRLVSETKPTCEAAGRVTYRCAYDDCHEEYSEESGAALDHDITGVAAIERATGNSCEYVLIYTCRRDGCGKEVEGEKVPHHHFVATIERDATCKTAGLKSFRCDADGCGATKDSEEIPASDDLHIWVKGEEDNGLRTDECSECHKTKTTKVYGKSTGATSAGDLKGSDLELSETNTSMKLDDLLENLGDQKIDVAAGKLTGEEAGLKEDELKQLGDNPVYNFTIRDESGSYLSSFGDKWVTITLPYTLSEGEDVDSIAIWYINDKGELTSIKATYSNGFVTFRTNHFSYYTVTRLTPKQRCELYGHNYASTVVPGSCTKDGYTLEVCVRCHDTQKTNVTKATGHHYLQEMHDASCTEAGYILYTCEGCDHSYRTKLNATGHDWEETVTRAATCSETGVITHTCRNCSESYTEQTAKLPHVLQETVIPATCEVGGLTRHACENCDYSYDDAYTPALGHDWSVTWVWAGGDTPTGATAHITCAHDAAHNVTLTANLSILVTRGTCSDYTKTDYTAAVSFDGRIWSDTKTTVVGTPEHVWSTDWKHDENGHWHECSCGAKDEIIPHSFGNATVTREPTCIANGEQTETCVCGETRTTVLPATGEHVWENGACKWCGKGEHECDHSVLHEEKLNLGNHGTRGESIFVYLTCECGEVKQLELEKSTVFCNPTGGEQKMWTDADGTQHMRQTGTCAECHVFFVIEASMVTDGCKATAVQTIAMTREGETLPTLTYTEVSYHHKDHEEAEIDLSKYGACAGTLTVFKCKSCGEILEIDGRMAGLGCDMDLKTEPKPETVTDENGVVHTIMKVVCKTCGLTVMMDEWKETKSVCVWYEHTTLSVRISDTVIASQTISEYCDSHAWKETYEMNGTTCEDGYTVIQVCEKCGQGNSWTTNGHREERFEIDFGEHGSCGGSFSGSRCKVCGLLLYMENKIDDLKCSFPDSEPTEIEVDGVKHQISVSVCTKCGMKMTYEEWEIKTLCENAFHARVIMEMNGETLFDGEIVQQNTHHDYEYEYTLKNPEQGCKGGWEAVGVCKNCGRKVESRGEWHDTEDFEIDLKETYGTCGNFLRGYRCRVCKEVTNLWLVLDDESCRFDNPTHEEKEIDGVLHSIRTEVCGKCGFRSVTDYWEVPGEDCRILTYEQVTYYMGDEKIVSSLHTDSREAHDYDYEYTFDHPELGCEGGLTVAYTCRRCGEKHTGYYTDHVILNRREFSDAELGCTHSHNLVAGICPCGRYLSVNWNDLEHRSGEKDSEYRYCPECGLTIRTTYQRDELDSCTVKTTETVLITQGDKELFSGEAVNTRQNHSFGNPELRFGEDGTLSVTMACANCQKERTVSQKTVALTERLEDDRFYYVDIPVTPETTALYRFLTIGERDERGYYRIALYRKAPDGLEQISGWGGYPIEFTRILSAGESYVIRIMGEEMGAEVRYLLDACGENEPLCSHGYHESFAVLPEGAASCEDGVWSGEICALCGTVRYLNRTTEHEIMTTTIDLAQYGGCDGGTLWITACACGKVTEEVRYEGCGEWNENSYTDEAGHRVTVEGRRCDLCGMKFTRSRYVVHDSNTCTDTYYYTVMLVRNLNGIINLEYTVTRDAHNYEISAKLDEGAKDCTGGVTVTYTCRDCGKSYSDHYNSHISYEKERIDLSEYGSTCGGYAHVYTCACGYSGRLEMDADCDFDKTWTENWLTSECRSQYQVDGWSSFSTSSGKWTCAVTDPQCGYVIRYASHWVRDAEACMAYLEEVWQFGYDAETDTCRREVVIRRESAIYHEYAETKTETSEHYDCTKCGSYYHVDSIRDEQGHDIKRTLVAEDKTGNSYRVYRREETEFAKGADDGWYASRNYSESRYRDGSSRSTEKTRTPLTELPFGDYGYRNVYAEQNNGTVTRTTESAFVSYKGYNFDLYRYDTSENWWEKYDYTYSFDGACTVTVRYTNENGENTVRTESACPYVYNWRVTKEATCSQPGEEHRLCPLCSRVVEVRAIEPDHNWMMIQGSGEEKMHICLRCGMMNVNGASGSIVMEDLTGTYGNGENYVVGYYKRNNVSFTYYVTLVDAEGNVLEELTVNDIAFTMMDGINAIAFSKAAVAAAAEQAGLEAGSYLVRFVFVPEYDEGNFDYAVTFDDEIPETVTDDTMFPAKLEAGGELVFRITPDAASKWAIEFTRLYGVRAVLCDEDGNALSSAYDWDMLSALLEAGKTYTVRITWTDENASGWLAVCISHTAVADSDLPENAA